ncbi:MAG: M3 family oligoendopeptidase [Spirochaetales bacterium]|nr:M3 family oligoendopeptidase [Spirochaetales bacterium]MCF7936984.1 M3 family oligoendopeptidase [Spirochaetales bacterium]
MSSFDRDTSWDLGSIFEDFSRPPYRQALENYHTSVEKAKLLLDDQVTLRKDPEGWTASVIEVLDEASDLFEELYSYAYTRFSSDTNDREALNALGKLEEQALPLKQVWTRFQRAMASMETIPVRLPGLEQAEAYAFVLGEAAELGRRQMPLDMEDLAADLSRPGGDAWSRLQESISANLDTEWDGNRRKTVTELRALAHDCDRSVRERAYRAELGLWKQAELPLSYALNGVKGFSVILNRRRGYSDTLERSRIQSRLSEKSFHALMKTIESSLPVFRRYLAAKASFLGLGKKLAFYDLFAPVGKPQEWGYQEAKEAVISAYRHLSPEYADFAERAFRERWIDVYPSKGKVGGAYCISFPRSGVSRVLTNFDGTLGAASTLAHELGHAWHHHVLRNMPASLRSYPMTLAETASIFSEQLFFQSVRSQAETGNELSALESFLQDTTQVVVDIYSRYLFESALFERRKDHECSPEELNELMLDAQSKAYGPVLDREKRHPYMWAVKGHYYNQDLGFYNFPYAFGLLFGLGLFQRYQQSPENFFSTYNQLLVMTGRAPAEAVAEAAGFDITKQNFWMQGIGTIEDAVRRYEALSKKG